MKLLVWTWLIPQDAIANFNHLYAMYIAISICWIRWSGYQTQPISWSLIRSWSSRFMPIMPRPRPTCTPYHWMTYGSLIGDSKKYKIQRIQNIFKQFSWLFYEIMTSKMCLLGYIAKVKGIVSRDEFFWKAFKIRKMENGLLFMKHFLIRKIRPISECLLRLSESRLWSWNLSGSRIKSKRIPDHFSERR